MSILDGVEPDWYGNANSIGEKRTALVSRFKCSGSLGLYSPETVESLIASLTKEHEQRMGECRKAVLLEAAGYCESKADAHGWNYDLPSVGRELGAELRRMAESTTEGEKSE
jgi:hypothetical protein